MILAIELDEHIYVKNLFGMVGKSETIRWFGYTYIHLLPREMLSTCLSRSEWYECEVEELNRISTSMPQPCENEEK